MKLPFTNWADRWAGRQARKNVEWIVVDELATQVSFEAVATAEVQRAEPMPGPQHWFLNPAAFWGFVGVVLVAATALLWLRPAAGHTVVEGEVATAAQSSPATLDTAHLHFVYGQADEATVVQVAARGERLYRNLQLLLGLPDRAGAPLLTVEIVPAAVTQPLAADGSRIHLTSPSLLATGRNESQARILYGALKQALVRYSLEAALRPAPPKAQWEMLVKALHSWLLATADGAPPYSVAVQRARWSRPDVLPHLEAFVVCVACESPELAGSGSGFQLVTQTDSGLRLLDFLVTQHGVQVIPRLLRGFHSYEDWNTLAPAVLGAAADEVDAAWQQGTGVAAGGNQDTVTRGTGVAGESSTPATAATPARASVPVTTPVALSTQQIIAKIPVGASPHRIAAGEGGVWVVNEADDTVSRVDPQTNQVVATIAVGAYPRSLAIGFGSVWIANNDAATISRIDPATNAVIATIPVGPAARGITAGAGAIWIASGEDGTVFRIDPDTNATVAKIDVGGRPAQMVAVDDAVWVTNRGRFEVTRIDPKTNTVAATIDLGCTNIGLAADATAAWVACETAPNLFRIDPATDQVATKIPIGIASYGIALGSDTVWITSDALDTLTAVDPHTNQVAAVYKVGRGPVGIAVGEGAVWVGMRHENTVWRIKPDPATLTSGPKGGDTAAIQRPRMLRLIER